MDLEGSDQVPQPDENRRHAPTRVAIKTVGRRPTLDWPESDSRLLPQITRPERRSGGVSERRLGGAQNHAGEGSSREDRAGDLAVAVGRPGARESVFSRVVGAACDRARMSSLVPGQMDLLGEW
jgi:hypothetical protein